MDKAVQQIASDEPGEVERGVTTLGRLSVVVGDRYDGLVWRYRRESDPVRREALSRAYHRLTGDDIDDRLHVLLD